MLEIEMCDQMLKIWKKKVIAEILTRVNKVIKHIKLECHWHNYIGAA